MAGDVLLEESDVAASPEAEEPSEDVGDVPLQFAFRDLQSAGLLVAEAASREVAGRTDDEDPASSAAPVGLQDKGSLTGDLLEDGELAGEADRTEQGGGGDASLQGELLGGELVVDGMDMAPRVEGKDELPIAAVDAEDSVASQGGRTGEEGRHGAEGGSDGKPRKRMSSVSR